MMFTSVLRRQVLPFIAGIALITLAGCGAGGSSPSPLPTSAATPSATPSGGSDAASAWQLGTDPDQIGLGGVSAFAVPLDEGGVRLYVTDREIKVYDSVNATKFAQNTLAQTPHGADPSIVDIEDGRKRMYYTHFIPGNSGRPGAGPGNPQDHQKQVRSATSSDGLVWSADAGVRIEDAGLGVPDAVRTPDGGVRIYWVDQMENIVSATSPDGLEFTPDAGTRLPKGYVDPAVIRATDGDWLMLVSTGPAQPPQQLHVATSADGLDWDIDETPLDAGLGDANVLDPTAIPVNESTFRVYFSSGDPKSGLDFELWTTLMKKSG